MKLKKIIIKKYDKDFEAFKNPPCFIYSFFSLTFFKKYNLELTIVSKFRSPLYGPLLKFTTIKDISPFSISSEKIKPIYKNWDSIEIHTYLPSWTTSILVHCFLFYTFFYEIAFSVTHDFSHKTYILETIEKKETKYLGFKNFYFPFIYFLTFKALKFK